VTAAIKEAAVKAEKSAAPSNCWHLKNPILSLDKKIIKSLPAHLSSSLPLAVQNQREDIERIVDRLDFWPGQAVTKDNEEG
jgi:hypothetical protein